MDGDRIRMGPRHADRPRRHRASGNRGPAGADRGAGGLHQMTEQEAKTKWCPRYQVATSGGDSSTFESDNRPPEYEQRDGKWYPTGRIQESARCIGSACMAWRWDGIEVLQLTPDETPKGDDWIAG